MKIILLLISITFSLVSLGSGSIPIDENSGVKPPPSLKGLEIKLGKPFTPPAEPPPFIPPTVTPVVPTPEATSDKVLK